MDDGKLDSLANSIKDIGIKEPLLVTPAGDDSFEVVAGHRRLLAARIAGLVEAPCIIETDEAELAAIRLHENIEREDLNTADEAIWLSDLFEAHGQDVDLVASMVKKSRNYVEERLILLRGNRAVFDALREGKIGFGVARELNKMTRDEDKEFHLEYARRGGCTIRQAREWREAANSRAVILQQQAERAAAGNDPDAPKQELGPTGPSVWSTARPEELTGSTDKVNCFFCTNEFEMWRCLRKFVCEQCAERYIRPAERAAGP